MALSPLEQLAVSLRDLTPAERTEALSGLSAAELKALTTSWEAEARPEQLPPDGDWFIWFIRGGRGSGKTRPAAEWLTRRVMAGSKYNNLLSRTHADVRDTMVLGESGLVAAADRLGIRCEYEANKRRVYWPDFNGGSQALIFGAHQPDESRGSQSESAWVDEFAVFPKKMDRVGNTALTNLLFTCRLGDDPRVVVTSTPKPTPEVKDLLARAEMGLGVVTCRMTLYDNVANLPSSYVRELMSKWKGTRLEAQEILGHLLDAVEGALWSPELLDRQRIDEAPLLDVIRVAVDPPGSATGAECGIVVGGVEASRSDRKSCFLLGDHSMSGPPEQWARKVLDVKREYHATHVVAEANQGHDMVRAVIHAVDPDCPVRKVWAHESKRARAEPVALLYEAGRVWHVGDMERWMELEAQYTGWDPEDPDGDGRSPDRLDAAVWLVSDLLGLLNRKPSSVQGQTGRQLPGKIA